ncbi:MAG: ribosomal protein L7/L12 [Candidatus Methylumidiphilus sp.]
MTTLLTPAAEALASALNIPDSYVYLLFGLVLGLPLGWVFGRQRRADSNAANPVAAPANHPPVQAGVSLVVNGHPVEVAPDVMEAIQALILSGEKIEAIKRLRAATGLNLAAAKSVVESLEKAIH